jgi:protease IV
MKKRPFLMAFLVLGAIFLFFFVLFLAVSALTGRDIAFGLREKVGVIEVSGVILSSKRTAEHLVEYRRDPSVKAIVLRIESPGGGVGPSQEIYEEVKKTMAEKPVVASMGAVAASGGYYVAAPAHRILANPGTITGSIGVIMEVTNFQELLEKIGLRSQVIKSGEYKDIGSPVRPWSTEEQEILQGIIDDVHQQFTDAVAADRGLDPDEIKLLADGRIFTGRQALAFGLIDELGNLQDAIEVAARLGGIKGEPRVVYPPRDRPGILEFLVQETFLQLRTGLQEQTGAGLQFLWSVE